MRSPNSIAKELGSTVILSLPYSTSLPLGPQKLPHYPRPFFFFSISWRRDLPSIHQVCLDKLFWTGLLHLHTASSQFLQESVQILFLPEQWTQNE